MIKANVSFNFVLYSNVRDYLRKFRNIDDCNHVKKLFIKIVFYLNYNIYSIKINSIVHK